MVGEGKDPFYEKSNYFVYESENFLASMLQ